MRYLCLSILSACCYCLFTLLVVSALLLTTTTPVSSFLLVLHKRYMSALLPYTTYVDQGVWETMHGHGTKQDNTSCTCTLTLIMPYVNVYVCLFPVLLLSNSVAVGATDRVNKHSGPKSGFWHTPNHLHHRAAASQLSS